MDATRRRMLAGMAAGSGAAALGLPAQAQAQAQDYPSKPIRLIVPYPPGGGTDIIARILQERMVRLLGQPLVIENRGGAGGAVGTEMAAKAPADGYTVLFTLSSHTINPAIFPKLNYDVEKDFVGVSKVVSLPQILVAHPGLAVSNLQELVAMAKSKPGAMNYASVGNGSPGHIAGELFKLRTGTDLVHIPYKGGGPAVTDVMAGQVPLLWVSIPAAASYVKAGKLKALAVSTLQRSSSFPDVPTVAEALIPDFEVDSWYAMFVPASSPPEVVRRLHDAVIKALEAPDVREKLLQQGSEVAGSSPGDLDRTVKAEVAKWKQLVQAANIKM